MEQNPLVPMDTPAIYRIFVIGSLESGWAKRLWGMTATSVKRKGESVQTLLIGEVIDQTALVGIINALYNSGHTVVSIERLPPDIEVSFEEMSKDV